MPEQKETTHTLMANELVVYRRERSSIWQCRFKVDGIWQRATTKERDLKKAKQIARELMIEAEIRKRSNLPIVTRRFRDVAKLALQRMDDKLKNKEGKVSYKDYKRVIEDYLIPILGNRLITNIDSAALDNLDAERIKFMRKAPSNSTLLTHNAALNLVFDEAVIRNFLTEANRPKLEAKGRKSDRRPAFDLNEIRAVLANLEEWIESAKNDRSKEMRQIMRDYIEILVDTGARPGVELLNVKWNQIDYEYKPTASNTGRILVDQTDGEEYEESTFDLNRTVEIVVSGKTGARTIIGRAPTVKALTRAAVRNYGVEPRILEPLMAVATPKNNHYVLRTKDDHEDVSASFQKMFERYLDEYGLLVDPKTEQKRVFYSLRHTYATLALTYDKINPHVLAEQMGTSIGMIEKHYSHLKVTEAIEQLRGRETRKLIANTHSVSEIYQSSRKVKAKAHKETKTKRSK
jgi:integrase